MINLATDTQLNIILNNTNKALTHALKTASPTTLKELSQFKDLKSILDSMLQETSKDSSSNKSLLQLVKNNPTLKNLGTTTQTINDLLNTLQSEKNPLPIEKTLKNFLVDVKNLKEPILKEKILNSGLFLESKLKNTENPQVTLKATLSSLSKLLEKSNIFNVRVLGEQLKGSGESKMQDVLAKLKEHIQNADTINRPKFSSSLKTLEHLLEPKMLTQENFNSKQLQQTITNLMAQLTKSTHQGTKTILDSLSKIANLLKENTSLDSLTQKTLPQEINAQIKDLKSLMQKSDTLFSKEVMQDINKLTAFQKEPLKEIRDNDLKAILHTAKEELSKADQTKTELIKHIDKLALQIDHAQLLSHLSNTTSLYLPFSWEQMKEGQISIHKEHDKRFNVDIDLNLKEYGALNLKLSIYDENQLNLHIYTQNQELKTLIKKNLPELRSNLISQQITPREMKLFDKSKTESSSPYEQNKQEIYMGFEVKA